MLTGPIIQIAYVVPDLDAAAEWWVRSMGCGPFFLARHMQHTAITYGDAPCAADFSAAFGMLGEINIELIQQHDALPSPYLAHVGNPAPHHIATASLDIDADEKTLIAAGMTVVARGLGETGVKWSLLEGGVMDRIELIQFPKGPTLSQILKDAAAAWDGKTVFL